MAIPILVSRTKEPGRFVLFCQVYFVLVVLDSNTRAHSCLNGIKPHTYTHTHFRIYDSSRTAMKRVGFAELDGGSYRPWFYRQSATTTHILEEKAPLFGPNLLLQDMGPQFGGEIVNYEHGLSFLTVHGSGHMVPQFRPQAALHLLDKLVHFQDLTPLLPLNATLANMTRQDFMVALDDWTESAQKHPYLTTTTSPTKKSLDA